MPMIPLAQLLRSKRDMPPNPVIPEAPDAEATACRLAYVALTRARDTLVLEWPQAAVQKALGQPAGPCFSAVGVLATRCGMSVAESSIRLGRKSFPARVSFCGKVRPPEFGAPPDLLAEGEAGLALVDHKSDTGTDFEAGFLRHWPQISAYVAGLRAMDSRSRPVLAAIHWIGAGRITFGRV